jgi:hypothetical protein
MGEKLPSCKQELVVPVLWDEDFMGLGWYLFLSYSLATVRKKVNGNF